MQKREFISQLLDMGKHGPLSLLTMNMDGEPYYRFKKASFLIGHGRPERAGAVPHWATAA